MPSIKAPVFAIVTPFDKSGHVDFGAMGDYIAFLSDRGAEDLIVNGTTAEFPSLTQEERQEILEFTRGRWKGRILANVSGCSVRDCQTQIAHATDHADALLLLPPYYYASPRPEGVRAFLAALLRRCETSIYLYNFPRHTQTSIGAELLASLAAEFPVVKGVKDSCGSIENALSCKTAGDFTVFFGGDNRALEALEEGLDGSSSGAGSAMPEYLLRIHDLFRRGDLENAAETQQAFNKWHQFRKATGLDEIAVTKAALSTRIKGFPTATRPPMVAATPEELDRIREFFKENPVQV